MFGDTRYKHVRNISLLLKNILKGNTKPLEDFGFHYLGPFGQMCFTVQFYEKSNIFSKIVRVSELGYTPECFFRDFIKSN